MCSGICTFVKKIRRMETLTATSVPNTAPADIRRIFERQKQHQWVVARTSASERIAKLERLHACVLAHRDDIKAAMLADFRKSPFETDISEMGVVLGEIRHTVRHLRSWLTPRRVGTPLTLFGSSSSIYYEPKGVCLIISPWNFPFNLTFGPLVSAITAGNCVMLKPSEMTPHSSAMMQKIVAECFPEEEVALCEGDSEVSKNLLELPFDHIFFTGSPAVGKIVMAAAAKNLTSVTLELGGKSPVIVDETADLATAAAKTAWLKCMNAGQICIEPDYVLVHESRRDELVRLLRASFEKFYGSTLEARKATPDLCRIVNDRHFRRIKNLVDDAVVRGARVTCGGHFDERERYIDPTILENVPDDALINDEEIFGPVLPIYTYRTREEARDYVNARPKPLAMYIFSGKSSRADWFIRETRSGGAVVNDCGVHFYNQNLPFGGVGNSGLGKSHGEFGLLEFSNPRGIVRQTRLLPTTDFFLPPYGSRLFRALLEGVVRWF